MQLNTELPQDTVQAQAPQPSAALPRPPFEPNQLDNISIGWMWLILALSWLLDRSLRIMNEPPAVKPKPPVPLSVPITSRDIRERRQRN
jgi:hypothetical protein